MISEPEPDAPELQLPVLLSLERVETVVPEVNERLAYLHSLLYIITGTNYPLLEALRHWERLLEHRGELNQKLGADVHLSTALSDYFTRVHRVMKNPVIVDYSVLESLQDQANKDFLTGLYTRRFFHETLGKEIARATRQKLYFSLVLLDVDNFKVINDTYGHGKGDKVLKNIAATISMVLRAQDFLSRYGGDEFLCLLPGASYFQAFATTERLRWIVNDVLERLAPKVPAAMSYGIACFPLDGHNPPELIRVCDERLYKYKGQLQEVRAKLAEERRKYSRMPTPTSHGLLYRNGKIQVEVLDLSYRGLSFKTPEALEIGGFYKIHLFLKPPLTPAIAEVEVREVKELPDGAFRIGCQVKATLSATGSEISPSAAPLRDSEF